MVVLFCWILTADAWTGPDDDHGPESFRVVLQRIIRAARENLRPLKTFRIEQYPGRLYWYEVETVLPDAVQCRIYEHPAMVYVCEMRTPPGSTPQAVHAATVQRFSEALGVADWKERRDSASVTTLEPVDATRNPRFSFRLTNTAVEVTIFSVTRPATRP